MLVRELVPELVLVREREQNTNKISFYFGEQKQNENEKFGHREREQNKNQTNKRVLSSLRFNKYLDSFTLLSSDFDQIKMIRLRKLLRLY